MGPAIRLAKVTKRYELYGSPVAQALGYMGLTRGSGRYKTALDKLDLRIEHGEKVGVIGRNGSGKTTLLRLIIDHTQPSEGTVEIDGTVQAMMQTGFGFNDDLTGIDNINNVLVYNGMSDADREAAVADIVEFVELDEFLLHPLKTYSLGMRARLEFATATAIHPDILAIDEVLGAGDGYFVRKCAERMRHVIADSTLVLVSHSLDQIGEYCERVIWLNDGRIVEDGPFDRIIKDYQRFMSKDEAKIHEQIYESHEALPDGGDDFAGKAKLALEKAREILAPMIASDADIESTGCRFDGDGGERLVLETGEPLTVRFAVRVECPGSFEPLLLGMSEHGAFVFEATGEVVDLNGNVELALHNPRAGIGVGNYSLVPALRRPTDRELVALGPHVLMLRVLPTNWSDPPLVHLEGRWRSGHDQVPVDAKVSAWV